MNGETLRKLREAKRLTQEEVANRAELSQVALSRIETGRTGLSMDDFLRITRALGERPGDLLENSSGLNADMKPVIDHLRKLPPPVRLRTLRIVEEIVGVHEDAVIAHADNVRAFPKTAPANEHTLPRYTPEFPVQPHDFIEKDYDYPLELHADEVEVYDIAAGVTGVNPENDLSKGHVIHGEVRDPSHRVIKVVGDSMAPTFCEGWKLLVDCKKMSPANDDPVAVYVKDEGSILGRWEKKGRSVRLLKDNDDYKPVDLGDEANWILLGTVQKVVDAPVVRRKKR